MDKYLSGKIPVPAVLYGLVATLVITGKILTGDFFAAGAVASVAMIAITIAEGRV